MVAIACADAAATTTLPTAPCVGELVAVSCVGQEGVVDFALLDYVFVAHVVCLILFTVNEHAGWSVEYVHIGCFDIVAATAAAAMGEEIGDGILAPVTAHTSLLTALRRYRMLMRSCQ